MTRYLPLEAPGALAPKAPKLRYRPAWKSGVVPWVNCDGVLRALLTKAWTDGELGHLLTPSQLTTNEKIETWSTAEGRGGRVYVLDSSRRWGKSALLLKRAFEKAIKNPGWRIVYFAPEYKMVHKIILPLAAMLTQDCPPGLHGKKHGPDWVKSEGTFYFKNGSRIELIGLDINPDAARGTGIDYGFGDELAFFDKLEYLMTSIILPQMMGRPHARLECASTPPVSAAHYWTQEMVAAAIQDGAHDTRTIEDADQYETREIEEFVMKLGGLDSTTCQREFYCNHVTDDTLAIIPEFRKVEQMCVRAIEAPPRWRNCVVAMDPGWEDNTAVLFGYWDFDQGIGVVEDEIVGQRLNSETIANEIRKVEKELWRDALRRGPHSRHPKGQPYMRITDVDKRLRSDLGTQHGIVFETTPKDNLRQQIDALRVAFSSGRIVIHPRCRRTIQQLRHGVWKPSKTRLVFDWVGGDFGHFDCIAALVYLWRAFFSIRHLNPYPVEAYYVSGQNHNPALGERPPYESRWHLRGRQFRLV